MIDSELLQMLRCPIDGIPLQLASESVVSKLNEAIAQGVSRDRMDQKVTEPVDGALVTADGCRGYPMRNGIPTLIADEAIVLE